jgi:hypothetical protein
MLPRGGIKTERRFSHIAYALQHVDVNDVKPAVQKMIRDHFKRDFDAYGASIEHIPTGADIGRQFRVYNLKDSNIIAVRSFYEMLNNPHGYGVGDFLAMTYVLPEFHNSYLLRAAAADIFYIAFKTGLMKRIYAYIKMQDSLDVSQEPNPWSRIDDKMAHCLGKSYKTNNDNPYVAKYINVSKTIETDKGRYSIFEVNAEPYNQMDLRDYYAKIREGWAWENLDELLSTLDSHAEATKRTARFGFVKRKND